MSKRHWNKREQEIIKETLKEFEDFLDKRCVHCGIREELKLKLKGIKT